MVTRGKRRTARGSALGRLLCVALLGSSGAACFIGDAADGLPCELDADCGLGVSCVEDPVVAAKCCGGSCSASSSSGPTASTSSSSSGSMDSTSLPATETSTGPMCGDGVVNGDEECDREDEDPEALPCDDECKLLCGNLVTDPGEDCDDQELGCGSDCKFSGPCGNEVLDDGEACDVRLAREGSCSEDCKTWTALEWDEDDGNGSADFCVDPKNGGAVGPWECARWTSPETPGARGSGPYFLEDDPFDTASGGSWPEAILRTRVIDFPSLTAGDSVEVEFEHELNFNFNSDGPVFVDYAELSLESAAAQPQLRFFPLGGSAPLSVLVDCTGTSTDDTCSRSRAVDYCDSGIRRTAGQSASPTNVTAVYPPDDVAPLTGPHRLRFLVRYDCANFDGDPQAEAWILHRLKVTVTKQGAGG